MNSANPYFRAFVCGAIWCAAIALKLSSRPSSNWAALPDWKWLVLVTVAVGAALGLGVLASRVGRMRSWWVMGVGTVVAWFVVFGVLLVGMRVAFPPKAVPEFAGTDEMMAHLAAESTKWVKADCGIDLDYSLDSIKIIEEELGRISKDTDRNNPKAGTFGIAMGYGAYVGEVLRRADGGSWAEDHPVGGERSFPLTLKGDQVLFPVGWCWKRLTNGEEENVYIKALALKANGIASSTNVVESR
ncbi:MAG: hypothetical protein AB1705_10510 [Verrucomicrobiota bacterium]